jgi:hypothetical protein
VALLVGKVVSSAWLSDHAALYLELGALTPVTKRRRNGSLMRSYGESTVFAGYSWRIERQRSIAAGSKSPPELRTRAVKSLVGSKVLSANIVGRLPELALALSGSRWLTTAEVDEGQPQWSISFTAGRRGHLDVVRGLLRHDRRGS